jgi:hypothetical protein
VSREPISTRSVSRDVVETDPIVLRQSETRRLVFLPTLIDRPDDPLRGYFVYQRKLSANSWEDIRGESLTSLKSGEGWVLELHSAEVSRLLEGLLARRDLYERHGIVWGEREFVSKDSLPQVVRAIIEHHHLKEEPGYPGGVRITRAAFQGSSDGSGVSVSVEDRMIELDMRPQELVEHYPGTLLAFVTAGFARQLGKGVVRAPVDTDLSHGNLIGPDTKSIQRQLAAAAEWEIGPGS